MINTLGSLRKLSTMILATNIGATQNPYNGSLQFCEGCRCNTPPIRVVHCTSGSKTLE